MLRVYVAGAISAPTPEQQRQNVARLKALTREIIKLGHSPYPTAYTGEWETELGLTPEQYYELDNAWVDVADVLVFVPEGVEKSVGTQAEIRRVRRAGKPTCAGREGFQQWLKDTGQGG